MKILLISLNAKYIHTALAIHSLKTYTLAEPGTQDVQIETAEFTINQSPDDIFREICEKKPDLLACSCYIWNVEQTKRLALLFHSVFPAVPVWLGGPEVSYDAEEVLAENPAVFGVLTGEGEVTFAKLVQAYAAAESPQSDAWKGAFGNDPSEVHKDPSSFLALVPGIVYRVADHIVVQPDPAPMNLDDLVFPYPELQEFDHRILYYESSRGCPFQCSYCLSSIDRRVRFKSLPKVFAELQRFLNSNIPLVKFVDRTFNCDHQRTLAIWNYIKEHDNQITRFHFEVTAELLNQEELDLLASLRPGLVQLEIGVQSANPETLAAIHRSQDIANLKRITGQIDQNGNVHQHLDLIAGLPFEDLESFGRSFDAVYEMHPAQLQLGFLKLLKGSEMHRMQETYELQCRPWPPYEIISTKWISAQEILFLKSVETLVETYYNSGQFQVTLQYLMHFYSRPWYFFTAFAEWMRHENQLYLSHSRLTRYDLLRRFSQSIPSVDRAALDAVLLFDLYLRENLKKRPSWAIQTDADKELAGHFFSDAALRADFLPEFAEDPVRRIRHESHIEFFPCHVLKTAKTGTPVPEKTCILFHYRNRNPLDHSAEISVIPLDVLHDCSDH